MPVQELSFSFLGHFARWSKKKERMLVVDRPAEVLNFEQKQLLTMVVFLFLCCNLSRLICIHYSQAVCKQCSHIVTCTLIYSNFCH